MTTLRLSLAALMALLLAACGSTPIPDPEPVYGGSEVDDTSAGSSSGYDDEEFGAGTSIPDDSGMDELQLIIYFDFDQSELRAEYGDLLARHANQLANSGRLRVRLEGHADERGSREYNIGLGERRAQAVRRMLLIQGASASQIATVSFGEERPAAFGSDKEAWAQNRRVEIRYIN